MKKLIKSLAALLTITLLTINSIALFAGAPPPPPPGHGTGGNVPGGGAPIGGGLIILVVLSVGYGARKVHDFKKRKLAE